MPQAILSDFIAGGHYVAHLRRTRRAYARRRTTLIQAAKRELGDALRLSVPRIGLHVVGWLPEGADEEEVWGAAADRDVAVYPLSSFRERRCRRPGLVLGYGAVDGEAIVRGVERLGRALAR